MARLTWEQKAGETVRTGRSTRGNTGTRAGTNGAIGGFDRRLDPRVGPDCRPGNRVARGGTQGGLNCLNHALPRCLTYLLLTSDADCGGGWERGRSYNPLTKQIMTSYEMQTKSASVTSPYRAAEVEPPPTPLGAEAPCAMTGAGRAAPLSRSSSRACSCSACSSPSE